MQTSRCNYCNKSKKRLGLFLYPVIVKVLRSSLHDREGKVNCNKKDRISLPLYIGRSRINSRELLVIAIEAIISSFHSQSSIMFTWVHNISHTPPHS